MDVKDLENSLDQAKSSIELVDNRIKTLTGRNLYPSSNTHNSNNLTVRKRIRYYTSNNNSDDNLNTTTTTTTINNNNNNNNNNINNNNNNNNKVSSQKHPANMPQGLLVSKKPRINPEKIDPEAIERNRRLFGSIMSSLQQFKATEYNNSNSQREQRRRELLNRREAEEKRDVELANLEKKELFKKREDLKCAASLIKEKMDLETQSKDLDSYYENISKYIKTKSAPPVYFLPNKHNRITLRMLEQSKADIQSEMTVRRKKETKLLEARYGISVKSAMKITSSNNDHSNTQIVPINHNTSANYRNTYDKDRIKSDNNHSKQTHNTSKNNNNSIKNVNNNNNNNNNSNNKKYKNKPV